MKRMLAGGMAAALWVVWLSLMAGAAGAAEISPVTVYSVSSQLGGREAIKSVDGSGLNASLEHDTNVGNMWLSNGSDQTPWIVYDLGGNYMVTNILVWNYNEVSHAFRGIQNVDILGSTDAGNYTLITNITLNLAPGAANYACNNTITNISAVARYVKLDAKTGGATPFEQCQTNATPVSPGSIIAIATAGVTVSSQLSPRIGANVVNASGLNTNTWWHGAEANHTWLSDGVGAINQQWIAFDLGAVYRINRFHVWNYIEAAGYASRGVNSVTIQYGKTEALGSTVAGISNFAASSAGGTWGQAFTAFTPFIAQYIRFAVGGNYGDGNYVGLSEVRFLGEPIFAGTMILIR